MHNHISLIRILNTNTKVKYMCCCDTIELETLCIKH